MDRLDRAILNRANTSIGFDERPFAVIARDLCIPEQEVLSRVRALKDRGVIRRIGAVLDPRRIGWVSTLCAADIPENRLEEFAAFAAGYGEITHNYVRDGHPSCWFTVIAPDRYHLERIIKEIGQALDVDILDLPARTVFKIRVAFDLD